MTTKEYKVVLAGAFGSGRSTFASRIVKANADKKKIAALKTETYPVNLHTSAGPITLTLYDSLLHAKGGMPDAEFFKNADAALLFYDITSEASYSALEDWHTALHTPNSKRGSAPLPTILVGSKLDLASKRAIAPKDADFGRTKSLPYIEVSSKANWKIREVLLGLVRVLVGTGAQLTDEVEFETVQGECEVDGEEAERAKKEYEGEMR